MGSKSDLFFMPLKVQDLWRSTMGWSTDAQALYRFLLEVQWVQQGVIPATSLADLQELTKQFISWGPAKFAKAWEEIQTRGESPKFDQDAYGFYNARGRDTFVASLKQVVDGWKGNLKRNGCKACKERLGGEKYDLGDGWVRICPGCGVDLWTEFNDRPWLPQVLPPRELSVVAAPVPRSGSVPVPKAGKSVDPASAYCMEVEALVRAECDVARSFNAEEIGLVSELFEDGVPIEVTTRTIRELARRQRARGESIRGVRYFLNGKGGGAIRRTWQRVESKRRPSGSSSSNASSQIEISGTVATSEEWEALRGELSKVVEAEVFATWFDPLRVASSSPNRLVLVCPSAAIQGVILADFSSTIDAVKADSLSVEFVCG